MRRTLLGTTLLAWTLGACTSPSAPRTDAGIDAPSPPTDSTTASDAQDLPSPSDACVPAYWDGGAGEAGPVVTEVHQFLTNCQHNENTDLITWQGAIYLIHRTSYSQILVPTARLHIYRSTDQGAHFSELAQLGYPGRDIRDPKFVIVGSELRVYSLSRLPGAAPYDLDTDTLTTVARTTDGMTWSAPTPVFTDGWSFWREVNFGGTWYAAAYQDGDQSIIFLSSPDGLTWTSLATVYNDACRIPLEPEPIFFPDGRVVVAVRLDDNPDYLDDGHEALCYADPPYAHFQCPAELPGKLDGPVTFLHGSDRYVIARGHLDADRKRTVIYRVTGDLHDVANVGLDLIATLPSAGDTSYAGITWLGPDQALFSYYSTNPDRDIPWWEGMLGPTDIFLGHLDFALDTPDAGAPFERDGAVNPQCRPLAVGYTDAGDAAQ